MWINCCGNFEECCMQLAKVNDWCSSRRFRLYSAVLLKMGASTTTTTTTDIKILSVCEEIRHRSMLTVPAGLQGKCSATVKRISRVQRVQERLCFDHNRVRGRYQSCPWATVYYLAHIFTSPMTGPSLFSTSTCTWDCVRGKSRGFFLQLFPNILSKETEYVCPTLHSPNSSQLLSKRENVKSWVLPRITELAGPLQPSIVNLMGAIFKRDHIYLDPA